GSGRLQQRRYRRRAASQDDVGCERSQFRRVSAKVVGLAGGPVRLDTQVATVHPPQLLQALQEGGVALLDVWIVWAPAPREHADAPHPLALLGLRRERPSRRRAAEKRDELAPLHSITSSARASSVGGTSRPRALAVLRLIAISNLVGACTGRSAAFSPLRMRSTYSAARGNVSPRSIPYETKPPSRTMNRNGYTAGSRWRAASAKIMLRCT